MSVFLSFSASKRLYHPIKYSVRCQITIFIMRYDNSNAEALELWKLK